MKFKYIVTDKGSFAIFSETAGHKEVANALYGKPVGAGFCSVEVGAIPIDEHNDEDINVPIVYCTGESLTLDLVSRGEIDEKIINDKLHAQPQYEL